MFLKELCISFDNPQKFSSLFLRQINRFSFLEIIVFPHRHWITISGLSSVPRALNIKSLCNFLFRVEHISHDDKITPPYLLTKIVFLDQLV